VALSFLHKGAFCVCIMNGYLVVFLLCGQAFTVDHVMNCAASGFPTLHHNELRDFIAAALCEVCCNVAIESVLQQLSAEAFHYATANV